MIQGNQTKNTYSRNKQTINLFKQTVLWYLSTEPHNYPNSKEHEQKGRTFQTDLSALSRFLF